MTPQLKDTGEETWTVKLHLGCGGVYLRGYINLDICGQLVPLGSPPDTATDVDDYYRGLQGDTAHVPAPRVTLCDFHCDLRGVDIVADDGTADKIIALQCLEHLTPQGAFTALQGWHRALHPGGVIVVTVPDAIATLDLIADKAQQEFAARHLLGTHKGREFWHRSWWSDKRLTSALRRAGFCRVESFTNPHFYPAVCLRAWKGEA